MPITKEQQKACEEFYHPEPKIDWNLLAQADNFRVKRRKNNFKYHLYSFFWTFLIIILLEFNFINGNYHVNLSYI